MPLIYSFVARDDKTVLAEYSPYHGNFNTVALECFQHLQPGGLGRASS
jgi:vesicle-associated membrane protein 7